jgi:hypothetical protein
LGISYFAPDLLNQIASRIAVPLGAKTKTAKALGLTIPQDVLAVANEVIE